MMCLNYFLHFRQVQCAGLNLGIFFYYYYYNVFQIILNYKQDFDRFQHREKEKLHASNISSLKNTQFTRNQQKADSSHQKYTLHDQHDYRKNRTDITPLLIQLHWLSELQQINFKLSLTFKALLCATYLPDLLQTYLPSCSLQSVSIDQVAASELWVLGPSSVMYWHSHSHTGLLNRKKLPYNPVVLNYLNPFSVWLF